MKLVRANSIALLLILNSLQPAQAQDQAPQLRGVPPAQTQALPSLNAPASQVSSTSPMTLLQIEQLAVQSNPTLAQAQSSIPSSKAMRYQAGLLPNPVVGGEVENFAFRALRIKPAYFGFGVQTIPLGGKLRKMRAIYNVQVTQAELEASMQSQRVLNNIRNVFYNVLGAQQILDSQTELATIARDATTTTSELFNVGQADKPDYLESKIEKEQVEHELVAARNSYLQS